ncbi:hypothetical protein PLICRDRAFT_41383 [Plicaturopsis crispa FD-325 SS-3]|nr:hypothetical protein PLICRDRAFT_41383 [Plicaturopsis crispa FD-325 SS-3]
MQFTAPFMSLAAALGLLSVVSSVAASPLSAQDVYAPPITSPTTGTIWTRAATQTVTWDVSNPPANITNRYGLIKLVRTRSTVPENDTLAEGFDILLGSIEVQVPDSIPPSDDYQIVLYGDSGDRSPEFQIA